MSPPTAGDGAPPDRARTDRIARSFVVATAGASAGGFAIAFELGAFGAVFYGRLHAVWALSTAVLLTTIVLGARATVPPRSRLVMAIPTLWLLVAILDRGRPDLVADMVVTSSTVLTLLTLPWLVGILASVVAPGWFMVPSRRLQIAAVAITVAISLAGFVLGDRNYGYLTCGDFVLSGDDQPPDCTPGPPTTRIFDPR